MKISWELSEFFLAVLFRFFPGSGGTKDSDGGSF